MDISCDGQYKAFGFLYFVKVKYAIDLLWYTLVD